MAETTTFNGAPWSPVEVSGLAEAEAAASALTGYIRGITVELEGFGYAQLQSFAVADFIGYGALVNKVYGTVLSRLPAELRLCRPFPYPALEECRQRTLQSVNTSPDITIQARTVLGFAYSTELKSVFVQLLDAAESSIGTVSGKVRATAIDRELRVLTMRYPQVFRELQDLRIPEAYKDLLEARLMSTSFNHRISAMCAMLILVAALLLDDEAQA